jgi:predicted RND superfamily exporter protein
MIALPLILGIGINDGIHVLHDYRQSSADRTYSLGATTATAITITSAATMAVFGSMMLADHRGLRSLGQVVTLGIFCCWFCSLFLLPALLKLIRRPADG